MHYQSIQSQAREKHQQLRREAQLHRQSRMNRDDENAATRQSLIPRMASALTAFAAAVIASVK